MKKPLLVCLFTLLIYFSFGQTLFTYGNHSVNAPEFLKAYHKNKTSNADSSLAMHSYLDLYIKFKLKVQAAKDMRLDTLPSLKADLQNFRSQIKGNYLIDQEEVNKLLDEAFTRSQKDIHALYYFIPKVSDTTRAYQKVYEVYQQLKNDNKDDSAILAEVNIDEPKVEKSDVGYITVFTLPYQFENIIYNLAPGQASLPYQTKKGWYVFKNTGERPAVGKITLAQILFAVPEGFIIPRLETKKLADSVYRLLMNGGDFAALATQFSNDQSTHINGGLMPEFGTAKYDSLFEGHAFALTKDGEISHPFETQFGYHIIKRISASPVPATKDNETFMNNLKQEVFADSRIDIAKQKFIQEISPKIGFKKMPINENDLWRVSDSSLVANRNVAAGKVNEKTTLFTYNNHESVKVRDWILYLRNSLKDSPEKMLKQYPKLFSQFTDASALNNYASRLEDFNPAFKSQMKEFEEGNMLFEVMQRKVWNKASEDTSGLRRYYNQHKQKYLWNSSAEAIIFSCSDKESADNSIKQLKSGKAWKEIVRENSTNVHADSGRYELGQIPVVDRTNFTAGLITLPVINKTDGTATFAEIIKLFPAHVQRNFDDARGMVVNDYQNYLDEQWDGKLRKKYPVIVNKKVFQELLK